MNPNTVLAALDAEIARLQQARALLAHAGTITPVRGKSVHGGRKSRTRRKMSPEARKRIAEGQLKRWAASRKSATRQTAKKTVTENKPLNKAVSKAGSSQGRNGATQNVIEAQSQK